MNQKDTSKFSTKNIRKPLIKSLQNKELLNKRYSDFNTISFSKPNSKYTRPLKV